MFVSRWWLNQPIWKICDRQIGSFPQTFGVQIIQIFELPPSPKMVHLPIFTNKITQWDGGFPMFSHLPIIVFPYSQCFIAFLSSFVKFLLKAERPKGLNSCNYRTAGQPSCRCSAGLISWGRPLNLWIGDVYYKYIIYILIYTIWFS